LIPLIGGTVTSASRELGHYLALGMNGAVFLFSIVFVWRQSARRANKPTHWQRMGPTYLTIFAALLILADNLRHVLQDVDAWPAVPPADAWYPSSSQYRTGCAAEAFSCLTTIGWIFTVLMTYLGFCIFFFATMWNANLVGKLSNIATQWRELREADHAASAASRKPGEDGNHGDEQA